MGEAENTAGENVAGLNKETQDKETPNEGDRLAAMTIEESFAALDELIDRLESGQGSLEEAFTCYEEGMKLVKSCNSKIEKIEKQVLVLNEPEGEEDGVKF